MRAFSIVAAALSMLLGVSGAWAQSTVRPQGLIVALCGTAPNSGYTTLGSFQFGLMDVTGAWCNSTNLGQIGGTTALTGTGLTGPGSLRVTIAQDPNTLGGSASIPTGTNIIGKVGIDQTTNGTTNAVVTGIYGRKDVSPTVTVGQYVSGNDIGLVVTFTLPGSGSGILQNLSIQFNSGATTAITGYCFDSAPTVASLFVDRSSFVIGAADRPSMINKLGIVLTPIVGVGGPMSAADSGNLALPFGPTSAISCVYSAGGTFTPPTADDMNVGIKFYQNKL